MDKITITDADFDMCFKIACRMVIKDLDYVKDKNWQIVISETTAALCKCYAETRSANSEIVQNTLAPQAQQPKKESGLEVDGEYLGRNLITKGEKDGKPWKLYKIQVKMANEKVWNFSAFNSCKGLSDVEKGDTIKVIYSQEPKLNKDQQEYIAKNAYTLIKRTEEPKTPVESVSDDLE